MKLALLLSILYLGFPLCSHALDANLKILSQKFNEMQALGHITEFEVIPTENITDTISSIELKPVELTPTELKPTDPRAGEQQNEKNLQGDEQVRIEGPLLIDLKSVRWNSGTPGNIHFRGSFVKSDVEAIPSLKFLLHRPNASPLELQTKPLNIKVSTNLQPGDETNPTWFWGLLSGGGISFLAVLTAILIGILSLGGIAWLVWKRWLSKRFIDKRTPLQKARERLLGLKNEKQDRLFSYGIVKETKEAIFYSLKTSVADLTDAELLQEIQDSITAQPILKDIRTILEASFEARYAKANLDPSTKEQIFQSAIQIINHLETKEEAHKK